MSKSFKMFVVINSIAFTCPVVSTISKSDGCLNIVSTYFSSFVIVASDKSSVGPLVSVIDYINKSPCIMMAHSRHSFMKMIDYQVLKNEKAVPRSTIVGFQVNTAEELNEVLNSLQSSSFCAKIIFLDRHPLFSGFCLIF